LLIFLNDTQPASLASTFICQHKSLVAVRYRKFHCFISSFDVPRLITCTCWSKKCSPYFTKIYPVGDKLIHVETWDGWTDKWTNWQTWQSFLQLCKCCEKDHRSTQDLNLLITRQILSQSKQKAQIILDVVRPKTKTPWTPL